MTKIIFYPKNKIVKNSILPPKPILVPDWFKKIPQYQEYDGIKEDKILLNGTVTNLSVKSCMPFLDSLKSGYAFYLTNDIIIKQVNGSPFIVSKETGTDTEEIVTRSNPNFPSWNGFDNFNFSWKSHWGIKTPKGYSCLFTHPLNRTDLPFLTTSGIIDTDEWGLWGNQPFAIQTGFEGVIPSGTPIIHFFPFKRENWESEIDDSFYRWSKIEEEKKSLSIKGYYKNNFWKKKYYK
jgi:hypothetical protein